MSCFPPDADLASPGQPVRVHPESLRAERAVESAPSTPHLRELATPVTARRSTLLFVAQLEAGLPRTWEPLTQR